MKSIIVKAFSLFKLISATSLSIYQAPPEGERGHIEYSISEFSVF